jgi:hypothetical protein
MWYIELLFIVWNTCLQINTGVTVLNSVEEMKKIADTMHKDLLELISSLSDATISERSSSVTILKSLSGCLLNWQIDISRSKLTK